LRQLYHATIQVLSAVGATNRLHTGQVIEAVVGARADMLG
jgi:hypothetical protein